MDLLISPIRKLYVRIGADGGLYHKMNIEEEKVTL